MPNTEVSQTQEATIRQAALELIDQMILKCHQVREPFVRYQIGMWVESAASEATGGLVDLTAREYMALREKLAELRADWRG